MSLTDKAKIIETLKRAKDKSSDFIVTMADKSDQWLILSDYLQSCYLHCEMGPLCKSRYCYHISFDHPDPNIHIDIYLEEGDYSLTYDRDENEYNLLNSQTGNCFKFRFADFY